METLLRRRRDDGVAPEMPAAATAKSRAMPSLRVPAGALERRG